MHYAVAGVCRSAAYGGGSGSYGNQYAAAFESLYNSGSATAPVAVPESKKEQKSSIKAAQALGETSWEA
jgi:hypothetical protein